MTISQTEIAVRLGCSVDTIRRQQTRLGCAGYRRKIDEQLTGEIIELHRQGLSATRIALQVGIGQRSVSKVLRGAGITLTPGQQPVPQEKIEAIDADIRHRVDFLYKIAKRHGVGGATVSRRKRELLGPGRLLSTWPPLQSKFSQRNPDARLSADIFVALARAVVEKSFGGQFPNAPERDAEFVRAAVEGFSRLTFKGQPKPVLNCLEAGLRDAVATLRLEQATCPNLVH